MPIRGYKPGNTIEGEGFGLGGFGGLDEPFGSIGFEMSFGPLPPPLTLGKPSKGASIVSGKNSVFLTNSGVIVLGRASNVTTSGAVCSSNRNLVFNNSSIERKIAKEDTRMKVSGGEIGNKGATVVISQQSFEQRKLKYPLPEGS